MSYFYGPVPSRRLGISLGVDLLPHKLCSFDCIYCQLKTSSRKVSRRKFYVNISKFRKELKEKLKKINSLDYITVSGSGEPTLHKDLDRIIKEIKKISRNKYPVCVITNSSLLYRKTVRRELMAADLIIPSLDAPDPKLFRKINRPARRISFDKIIKGILKLREEFKGRIWLEIMLIKGVNDSISCANSFKEIIRLMRPDKVQINLPVRPNQLRNPLPPPRIVNQFKNIISEDVKTEVVSYLRIGSRRRAGRASDRAVMD
ncbi:MAG: radical SAM protein, partial [Candidatus Omnitrophica bacterium]|nr:radical SAM protein [Candidatus Omnitrophota bacterium]MBD3269890.1 radical SAM protein [Candidatus Omnitrophota bacterium]